MKATLKFKHLGPGPHPDGTPQSIHAGGGGKMTYYMKKKLGLNKPRAEPKAKLDIDRAWWYYHRAEPRPDEIGSNGVWAFSISGWVKYFKGKYKDATIAARRYADQVGADVVYLKP